MAATDDLTNILKKWCFSVTPDGAPAVCAHALILGEKGVSKTHTARVEAANSGFKVFELTCHEGTTAYELAGSYVPYMDGTVRWQDGKVSEAVRCASEGVRTVLIIDEILRSQSRALSVLLGLISPHPVTGMYSFTTSRAIGSNESGMAIMETITCDPKNLTIIATSNIGASYQINDLDPAIQDRFIVVMQQMTTHLLKSILTSVVDKVKKKHPSAVGGILPKNTVAQISALWTAINTNVNAGKLSANYSTRKLCAAIEHCYNSPLLLADNLRDLRFAVVKLDNNGKPIKEEEEIIQTLIKTHIDDKVKGENPSIANSQTDQLAIAMATGTRIMLDTTKINRTAMGNIISKLHSGYPGLFTANMNATYKKVAATNILTGSDDANTIKIHELCKTMFPEQIEGMTLITV
jgi:AAA domain (dynein-related subfamily)